MPCDCKSAKSSAFSDCSVPSKMSWDELEAMCRLEGLKCKEMGITKANVNEYEVEFLCDYKKTKVRYLFIHHHLY